MRCRLRLLLPFACMLLLFPAVQPAQTEPASPAVQGAVKASVSLAWDPSISPNIAGYKVYYGNASRTYGQPTTIGNVTTYTVLNLTNGPYYFAVTAFDTNGNESGYSNEVYTYVGAIGAQGPAGPQGAQGPPGPAGPPGSPPTPSSPQILFTIASNILATQLTVSWATDVECSGTVLWGSAPDRLFAVAANNLGTTDHLAVVAGLASRTHYFYKVQSVCNGVTVTSDLKSFNTK